ncbi:MAG TPA: PAS domain-containing protein [Ferrovibrio sp.]|uniref:PAS domain-containing protein n=1 Tax=Ferrovibrio sp. TaxID=1917215 RepID=UPI002B4AC430|nr:PAS domain-containing protein [Ferrovibrio sp.]HLT77156.1 PAS domain-containing protein [Ferrovibrio sp.]
MDTAFLAALPADGMRRMLRHWNESRGSETVPRQPPFTPTLLPEQLALVQVHERKTDGRFLCRLSGTAIVEAFGFESTGRHVDELAHPSHVESRVAILNETLRHGSPIFYSGRLLMPLCRWKGVQRLLLPYADSRGDRRFVFSMLHFLEQQPVGIGAGDIADKRLAFPGQAGAI